MRTHVPASGTRELYALRQDAILVSDRLRAARPPGGPEERPTSRGASR